MKSSTCDDTPDSTETHEPKTGLLIRTPESLEYRGGDEIFQNRRFAQIIAEHTKNVVIEHHGLLVFTRRLPFIPVSLHARIGSPERRTDPKDWETIFRSVPCGELNVSTNSSIDSLSQYLHSPPDTFSFVIDLLEDEETLWGRLPRRCRKSIRIGRRAGCISRPLVEADLEPSHELLMRVTNNGKKYWVPPLAALRALFDAKFLQGLACFRNGDQVGVLCFLMNHHAYGWAAAYDLDAANRVPSNLMYWESILWAKHIGMRVFDFGAQSIAAYPSLTKFKRNFTPYLVPAYLYRFVNNPLLHRAYKLLTVLKKGY